jgi:hypothetical protein
VARMTSTDVRYTAAFEGNPDIEQTSPNDRGLTQTGNGSTLWFDWRALRRSQTNPWLPTKSDFRSPKARLWGGF